MKANYFIIPLIAIITAITGSFITSSGMNWYKTIKLPTWTPAGSIIGAVWTILFILAAASALIVYNQQSTNKNLKIIIIIFLVNAVLNMIWSLLFFGWHFMGLAVGEAALLGLSVLALIILIWPASIIAALLLLLYFLWTSFATFLTYSVWLLNK